MDAALAEAIEARRRARELCPAPEVERVLAVMAGEIDARFSDTNPVILAVMSGGVFTATRLCGHFDFPYQFDYVHPSRYRDRLHGGDVEWRVRAPRHLAGRTVVVIDDVIDHGLTLTALIGALQEGGAERLAVAVLVRKAVAASARRPAVDFVGLEAGSEYLFGCGMDYKGYWRGLPALYSIPASWSNRSD